MRHTTRAGDRADSRARRRGVAHRSRRGRVGGQQSSEVDWLAADGYNWGAKRDWGRQSYAEIFVPTVAAFRRLAPRRPVMIAEVGCAPDRRKASWVTETFGAARADGVDAIVWFEFAKETDWRLSERPAAAEAARAVMMTPAWRQGGDLAEVERFVSGSQ